MVLWMPIVILVPTFSDKAPLRGSISRISRIRQNRRKILGLVDSIISRHSPGIGFGRSFRQPVHGHGQAVAADGRGGKPGGYLTLPGMVGTDHAQGIPVEECAQVVQVPAPETDVRFRVVEHLTAVIVCFQLVLE